MPSSRFPLHFVSLNTVTGVALCLALFASGCTKKPVRTTPPVLIPSIESEPLPTPPSPNLPNENTSSVPETPPTPQRDAQKPKPRPRKPIPRKPVQPTPPAATEVPKPEPAKNTMPDSSVQITADVPRAAVQSQKQNTEQLLRNSEGRLSRINRNLSASEQGMLRQARNYIAQSNQALQGGDVERAYNLAVKANLLSNELVK
jgi:outer membrane biosynthesis protein TonB